MFGNKAFRACIMNTVEQIRIVGLSHIRNFALPTASPTLDASGILLLATH